MTEGTHINHIMGELGFFLGLWLLYLAPILLVAGPVWFFGRKRVAWTWIDYAIVVLPYWAWAVLMIIDGRGKSLSNAVVEPFWLGVVAVLPSVVRVISGKRLQSKLWPSIFLVIVVLVGVVFWQWLPGLPE